MILKPVFIIAIVAVAMIGVMVPSVFADHSEVTITPISGSGSGSGCELTEEGCYNPSIATVDVGGVVIFSNTDSVSHVFSSGTPSDDDVGTEFNSGLLAPGNSAEWKPENVGKFPYFDMVNPWMVGEIIVTSVLPDDIQNDSPIASFVDQTKDPQHYIDRYNNEPTYKEWFDENYSQYSSIYQAVGLEELIVEQTNEPEYVSEPEYAPEPIVEPIITCEVGTELLNGFCQGVGDLQRATYSNSKLNFSIDIPKIFRGEIYEGYYPNHVEILSVLGVGYYDDVNEIYDPNLSNEEKMNVMLVETMDAFNSPNEAGVTSSSISVTHQEIIEKKEFTLFDLDLDLIATYPDGTVTPMEYKTREIHSSYSNEAWILSMHDDIDARDTRNIYYVMLDSFKILDNNRLEYLENIVQQEILSKPTCGSGTKLVNGICEIIQTEEKTAKGGGCLIATATYGSEMATEVQQLRELRDNTLLNTESGTAFMSTFNDVYYSFSPIVADYERENPYFKEAVKLAITPMISSLSLMENANSESEVLSIGISVIMLNLGMYLGVPAIVVIGIRKRI
jgi:plastocyanin